MAESEATIVIRARDEASATVQRFGGQMNNLNKMFLSNIRSMLSFSAILSGVGLSVSRIVSQVGKYITETRAANVATGQLRNLFLLTGLSAEQVNSSLDILRKTFDKTTFASLPQNIDKLQEWLELSTASQQQIADWADTFSVAYGIDKTELIIALTDALNGNFEAIKKLIPGIEKLTGPEVMGKLSTEYARIKKELAGKPTIWDELFPPAELGTSISDRITIPFQKGLDEFMETGLKNEAVRFHRALQDAFGNLPPLTINEYPSVIPGYHYDPTTGKVVPDEPTVFNPMAQAGPSIPVAGYQPGASLWTDPESGRLKYYDRGTNTWEWAPSYVQPTPHYEEPEQTWEDIARAAGLMFQKGGTVPGPIGQPSVALVHGGETITPPGQGTTIVIPVSIGGQRLETIVLEVLNGTVRRRMSEIA